MPDDIDNLEAQSSPSGMSAEQLDALLAGARWPQMSPATLDRIAMVARPPAQAGRRGRTALWIGSLAAAAGVAVAATIWALWPAPSSGPVTDRQPEVRELEPSREPEAPRFRYAVLPAREATTAERAWAQVIQLERAVRAKEPPQEEPGRPVRQSKPSLSEIVRPGTSTGGRSATIAQRPQVQQLLATLLDLSAELSQRDAAARALPATVLEQALIDPALASRDSELAAALAVSEDPAAGHALVRLAERNPELAHRAVATAPVRSAGVLGLVDSLDDPLISRREKAAGLLAASNDPAVLEVLSKRLAKPASRREVLIALLLSGAPGAQAIVARADAHPELAALVRSLRLQGYGSPRQTSHLQMTIL